MPSKKNKLEEIIGKVCEVESVLAQRAWTAEACRPVADRECRSVSRVLSVVTYWVSLLPIMPRRTRKS